MKRLFKFRDDKFNDDAELVAWLESVEKIVSEKMNSSWKELMIYGYCEIGEREQKESVR